MDSDRRIYIRPTPEDLATDEAIEAFAHKLWLALTNNEEEMPCNDD